MNAIATAVVQPAMTIVGAESRHAALVWGLYAWALNGTFTLKLSNMLGTHKKSPA